MPVFIFLTPFIGLLKVYILYMLGSFNPSLGQIWTDPNVGLKM